MLILSRNVKEKIMICSNIQLIVMGINGKTVQLGFEAPPSVTIYREEVYRRIQQEIVLQSNDSDK